MKITELMQALQSVKKLHGNLPVVGGILHDDTPLKNVIVVDAEGRDVEDYNSKAVGIFLTC